MNLGERVSCGQFLPKSIGVANRRVESVHSDAVDASSIILGGTNLQTTLTNLAGGSATADWSLITNKPANLVDWTQDQGDTNIDANNIPLLNYAPNALASNGTAGLSSYNFTLARRDKLAGIAEGAEVNVQADWNESDTSSDAFIANKPTNLQQSLTINNTFSSTFNGVTYLFGGLDLTNGTLTYIPQQVAGVYAPLTSPSFTGTVVLPSTTSIGAVSATELGYLDGVTSAIQTQLDAKQATLTGTADVPGLDTALSGKQATIGYVPANRAGDTFTGDVNLTTNTSAATSISAGNLSLSSTSSPSIEIDTDGVGLYISRNSGTQQGRIYNSSSGDHSLTVDAYSDAAGTGTTMGIQFRTGSGNNRMKVTYDGDVGIGTDTPASKLEVDGTVTCDNVEMNNYIHLSDGDVKIQGKTSSSSYRTWQVQGWVNADGSAASGAGPTTGGRTNILEAFLYNTDISYLSIHSKGYNWLVHNSNGNDLRLTCKTLYVNSSQVTSDDRLKHNEAPIIDALSTIRKLNPQVYDKSSEFDDTINTNKEAGFIAQQVYEIPELRAFVKPPETDPEIPERYPYWALNYGPLFTYNVAAVKELDAVVQVQAAQLSTQAARLAALEARMARLAALAA
jgi:hypothetical protein